MRRPFYGWYVVASAFLVAIWGWGLGFYGPSIYLVLLGDIHGWSASTISGAITGYYLAGAAMIALVGAAIRRLGRTAVLLTGVSAMATGVTLLTLITHPWQLYLTFLVMAIGWATMSSAMINILLAPWFERKRGMAVSLAMNGASLGGVLIAPGVLALVRSLGFERGLYAAVLAMLIVLVPPVVTVLRRSPAELGLSADGDGPVSAFGSSRAPRAQDEDDRHRQRATRRPLGTLAYWTISIPFGLGLAAQVGFLMHEVAFLTPLLGTVGAGMALSITTLAAVAGRLLLGTVIDRMDARQAAGLNFLVEMAGLALLLWRPTDLVLFAGCAVVGLGVGNMTSLPGLLVQREFSRAQFASVVGLVVATNQVVYSFAPGIIGILRDATGDYAPALWLCLALHGLATAVVVLGRRQPAPAIGGRAASGLELRPNCECCNRDLAPDSPDAFICSFECTFCRACAEDTLDGRCPNCGGELVRRPVRPREKLVEFPARATRIYKPEPCGSAVAPASSR